MCVAACTCCLLKFLVHSCGVGICLDVLEMFSLFLVLQ